MGGTPGQSRQLPRLTNDLVFLTGGGNDRPEMSVSLLRR